MKMGEAIKIKASDCLNCHKSVDGISQVGTNPDSEGPKPGDVTICIYCGHLMSFEDDRSLRNLNDEEIVAVAGDKRILVMQLARAMLFAKKSK